MAGPGDAMAAGAVGRGPMRASHADREQVIEVLKDAFVHGRLNRDQLDARAGQALAARTYAELAAVTADIPPVPAVPVPPVPAVPVPAAPVRPAPAPAVPGPTRPLVPARRRPLASVAAGSGSCLVLAAAAVWASFILDPGGPGADRTWAGLMLMLGLYAVVAGVWILGSGVSTPVPRGSGRQLPR
jgi:hypothetical protein